MSNIDPIREHLDAVPETTPVLPVVSWGDMRNAEPIPWLIKTLLTENGLSVVYGEPEAGKSFFALHMSAHVAKGEALEGMKVKQGPVLYLGLEGGRGIQSRILAYQKHNGEGGSVPFYLVPTSLDLLTGPDLGKVIETVEAYPNTRLIVVDTLSRAIAGGNENSPDDMGAFIRNMDRIRAATGAHVMIIHHGGKDQTRGARGHSSLKAAADTEIEVSKGDGLRIARVTKQKDGPGGQEIAFDLEQVHLGTDEDGDPVTSCVVVPLDIETVKTSKRQRVTGAAGVLLSALHEAIADAGIVPPADKHIPANVRVANIETVRNYAYKRGISDGSTQDARTKAFRRALGTLQDRNMVGIWDQWIWAA